MEAASMTQKKDKPLDPQAQSDEYERWVHAHERWVHEFQQQFTGREFDQYDFQNLVSLYTVEGTLEHFSDQVATADDPISLRNKLLRILQPCRELDRLAEMLDPHARTPWKLVLKRRRRGSPSKWGEVDLMIMEHEYEELVSDLEKKGARSKHKLALAALAKSYKLTDETIRQLLRGSKKRKWRNKQRSGHKES
jgi:hypothetical protein